MTDWKAHWDKIYKEKNPLEVSWYQKEPILSIRLINDSHIASDAPIIDVGGGASLLVDRLTNAGFTNLAVLDISSTAITHAQTRLGEKSSEVEWYVEDITRFSPPHEFALWHDRAVFHFLTDAADRMDYIKVLKQALTLNGHLIIAAFAIGGPTQCSGLKIIQYDEARLLSELGDAFELVDTREEIHVTPAEKIQNFCYFRLVRRS